MKMREETEKRERRQDQEETQDEKEDRRERMKKKREDERDNEEREREREREMKRCEFLQKNVSRPSNPPDELAQHVSKKNPFRTNYSSIFSSKVQNLAVF